MKPIPSNLDVNDVLALIEGGQPANARALRDAIESDPEFGRLLVEMRADRASLCSLRPENAPASILEGVEARLEREVLAGIARSEPTQTSIPVSSMVTTRPNRFQLLLESRSARRFALAAGLAIVGGITLMFVSSVVKRAMMVNDSGHSVARVPEESRGDDPLGVSGERRGERAVARTNPSTGADASPFATTDSPESAVAAVSHPEDAPTFTEPNQPTLTSAEPGIGLAKALELAAEGRLVIRVRTQPGAGGAQAATDDIRALAQRSSKGVKWRSLESAPLIVNALASNVQLRRPLPLPATAQDRPTASADANSRPQATPGAAPKTVANLQLPPEFRPLYTVEFDQTERTLESLLRNLDKQNVESIDFVELAEPVAVTTGLDPASMLWWGRRSSEWVKRIAVPIVLETPR